MSATNFLQLLVTFPKDNINDEMIELLEPYFDSEDYTLEVAKKVCGNVAGLLSWTKAMYSFFFINKEVLPLKVSIVFEQPVNFHIKICIVLNLYLMMMCMLSDCLSIFFSVEFCGDLMTVTKVSLIWSHFVFGNIT